MRKRLASFYADEMYAEDRLEPVGSSRRADGGGADSSVECAGCRLRPRRVAERIHREWNRESRRTRRRLHQAVDAVVSRRSLSSHESKRQVRDSARMDSTWLLASRSPSIYPSAIRSTWWGSLLPRRRKSCSPRRLPVNGAEGTSTASLCPIGGKFLKSSDLEHSIHSGQEFATTGAWRGGIVRIWSCSHRPMRLPRTRHSPTGRCRRALESEWVYRWVADAQAGTAVRRLAGRVLRRARKALRPSA